MQIVHFNTKYGSYDEAISREDGLAVFAFLFKVSHVVFLRPGHLLFYSYRMRLIVSVSQPISPTGTPAYSASLLNSYTAAWTVRSSLCGSRKVSK